MSMHRRTIPATGRRRSAVVTVMVLVVLLLLSGLVIEFVRRAVTDRRQMRQESEHQQSIQLAEAGIELLQQKAQADSNYHGETWEIPAGIIHQTNSAQVQITAGDGTGTVVARYPSNADLPFQVTRTVRLSL